MAATRTAAFRVAVAAALIAAAFALDQLTKSWALTELGDGRTIELALGARLKLIFNPGVAFGMGSELGPPLAVGLIGIAGALTVWVFVRAARGAPMGGTALLALAAGGGAGNIWDRISRATGTPLSGEVVDFIAVDWFAIFNVADIFTTCGIAGWAVLQVFGKHDSPEPRRSET
ncbi:signal peptidase II [Rathayibacter festucae]|jgi:signal peptidase II|uniref:signal peptidase II n=1 Tax=Rathayibacter TaxID=33886 RepID=UPI0013162075|nr:MULTISPECIES: signal peptidase II [Rathayibacter]MCJ1702050.1 signal peptidase II [Rathayibacter festucae]QHC68751.1 signal peptidase II [Rathayibacter sp. VKM Ac-2759]